MLCNESFSLPRGDRGQALVEMAIVLTVLLLLLTGIIEFGRILSAQLIVSHASREGARIGVLGKSDAEITARVLEAASALDESKIGVDVTPTQSERVRGAELRVEVSYLVDIVVPLLGEILTNPYPVRGVTVMRVE
ncbi:MAG: TadE/TadG family type IV pilus assembly protein [Bacillota bacterium]